MSIAGGVGSECGDIPIFITSVIPSGPIGRTGQINVSICASINKLYVMINWKYVCMKIFQSL